jgi:putative transport protein
MRRLFGVNVKEELQAHAAVHQPATSYLDVEVANPDLNGVALRELAFARAHNVVFSRILHDQQVTVPTAETRLAVGDVLRAVATKSVLDRLVNHMGRESHIDLATLSGDVKRADIVVTRTAVLRKTLRELDMTNRHGVALAGLTRAGVNLIPTASTVLHFGDSVVAVGPAAAINAVEEELGNSLQAVNRSQLVPIFLGIGLGVLVGSIPIAIPGVRGGLRLGLASGPMLVAIMLSRLGNIGSMVWHMPAAANQLFRDFGLAVFLACVGLEQGDHFAQKLLSAGGLELVAWGAVLTVVPLMAVGVIARKYFKMNFIVLSGWAAGAMTSTPALLFAAEMTQSDAPALAYAAVAPLALIVPILCCQVLAAM